MKVAVGSTNPTKINAVRLAFKKVWPTISWQVISIEAPSGISNQPMSDRESIRGARNRAKYALKIGRADFGVGLEGGMQKIGNHYFDCGWMVIVDKKGVEGVASTLRMIVPPQMVHLIKNGKELGEVIDIIFKTENAKQKEGHFGLMTDKVLTRTNGYADAVIAALARFIHPEVF